MKTHKSKNKNGRRMEYAISALRDDPGLTYSELCNKVRVYSKGEFAQDSAETIRTIFNLHQSRILTIQNSKVSVPEIKDELLRRSPTNLCLGFLITLEVLRNSRYSLDLVRERAKEWGYDYDPFNKPCIPAGVRYLYEKGILDD